MSTAPEAAPQVQGLGTFLDMLASQRAVPRALLPQASSPPELQRIFGIHSPAWIHLPRLLQVTQIPYL
jgi:hypothetical protein